LHDHLELEFLSKFLAQTVGVPIAEYNTRILAVTEIGLRVKT